MGNTLSARRMRLRRHAACRCMQPREAASSVERGELQRPVADNPAVIMRAGHDRHRLSCQAFAEEAQAATPLDLAVVADATYPAVISIVGRARPPMIGPRRWLEVLRRHC